MLVRRQEMLHRQRHGEFQIHAAAIAKHHDEEIQLSARIADPDRAVLAPVNLCGFAGFERQLQEGGAMFGAYQAVSGGNKAQLNGA